MRRVEAASDRATATQLLCYRPTFLQHYRFLTGHHNGSSSSSGKLRFGWKWNEQKREEERFVRRPRRWISHKDRLIHEAVNLTLVPRPLHYSKALL